MKVKNIMFFGFAAAILSATGAANAAATTSYGAAKANASEKNIVTSKYYVDTSTDALRADIDAIEIPDVSALESARHTHANGINTTAVTNNGVVTINVPGVESMDNAETTDIPTVRAVHNFVTDGLLRKQDKIGSGYDNQIATFDSTGQTQDSGKAFDTANGTITADSTTAIPSSAQVAGYVATQITESAYNDTEVRGLISDNATNITKNANDIDSLGTNKQDKPASAIANNIATFGVDKNNIDSGKAFDTANGTITADSTTAIPSSAQVAGYVATQITESAYNDTEVRGLISDNTTNITTNTTNIATNANDIDALETGKQDKPASAIANNIATFNADKNNIDSGKAFDTANGTITASSTTAIPSSAQVAGYVATQIVPRPTTGNCSASDTEPCALVAEGNTMVWRRMAQ